MSRKVHTEALKKLVAKHYELLALHYRLMTSSDTHWATLTRHTHDLHQLATNAIAQETGRDIITLHAETTKQLIVSHWQLWRAHHGEEPPTYLVDAIDGIEHHHPAWFSYEQNRWVEE